MSCRALIESLSSLVEADTNAFMELFMSKGMGGWIKSMMLWICKLLKFIINELVGPRAVSNCSFRSQYSTLTDQISQIIDSVKSIATNNSGLKCFG